jgi:hypothetical protein
MALGVLSFFARFSSSATWAWLRLLFFQSRPCHARGARCCMSRFDMIAIFARHAARRRQKVSTFRACVELANLRCREAARGGTPRRKRKCFPLCGDRFLFLVDYVRSKRTVCQSTRTTRGYTRHATFWQQSCHATACQQSWYAEIRKPTRCFSTLREPKCQQQLEHAHGTRSHRVG